MGAKKGTERQIMTLSRSTLELIDRGWFVFPLKPRDKYPLIAKTAGGNGFKDATRDHGQIKTWWRQHPQANIGVACGASNLYVVDCDYGLASQEEFDAWRMRNNIPVTFTVRTGRRVAKADGVTPVFCVQMYYSGAIEENGKWELDGCKGEIRSIGGYVCGMPSIHPDSGEAYAVLDNSNTVPRPELSQQAVVRAHISDAARMDDGESSIVESRNMTMTSLTGKVRHALSLGYDALLEHMSLVNERRCKPPLNEEELERIVRNQCSLYELPAKPPTIIIGGKKYAAGVAEAEGRAAIKEVEELDSKLTATPLPAYPLDIFEGTLYGEFAKRAAEGNFVPREFFIEGAMTYAGAAANDRLRGGNEAITSRLYTVLIGVAGIGKGTTFKRIRKFIPPQRLLIDINEKSPCPPTCSVLIDRAGSEPGLNDALMKWPCVIEDFEEMDRLMEKTNIKNSGGSLMSIIRTCFDDTVPGITTTGTRKRAATLAYLSLLGAMTPSLWRQAMEGKDSYGSGVEGST
jgi:hypothetical protein